MRWRVWAVITLTVTSGCGGPSSTPDQADGGNTHDGGSSSGSSSGSSGSSSATSSSGSSGNGSGGALGSATVNGTLGGKTLTPVDAASYYSTDALEHVILYDAPGACGDYLLGNTVRRNSSVLLFYMQDATVGHTYQNTNVAFAEFDGTCNSPPGVVGSGTVTLTAVSASSMSGDFSFTLNSDTITGSFVAPTCAGAPGTGAATCR